MYLDLDESIPDDDELHGPHYGDTDSEDSLEPEGFDHDLYEGGDDEPL